MVTTRSQEKKTQETPRSSISQTGLAVSAATPTPFDHTHSPRYFTPATSKPARTYPKDTLSGVAAHTDKASLKEETVLDEASAKEQGQPDDAAVVSHGQNIAVIIPSQPKLAKSADDKRPSKAAEQTETLASVVGELSPNTTSTQLPERPKAAEVYFTPMTTHKRKRFDGEGEDVDDSVSTPLQEQTPSRPGGVVNHEVPDSEADEDDDAPEVLSSKAAARQALQTPNPISRSSRRKRTRTDPTVTASSKADAERAEDQGDLSLSKGVEHSKEAQIAPPAERDTTNSSKEVLDIFPATSARPETPRLDTTPAGTDTNVTGQAPAPTASSEPAPHTPLDTHSDDQGNKEVSPVLQGVDASTASGPRVTDIRKGDREDTHPHKDETDQPPADADDAAAELPSPSSTATRAENAGQPSDVPAAATTTTTTTTITTAIATTVPTAQITSTVRGVDGAPASARHPLLHPRAAHTIPKRPKQQLTRLLPEVKPKASSLQEYRGRLLNRHPRTTKWGNQRRVRFVGA